MRTNEEKARLRERAKPVLVFLFIMLLCGICVFSFMAFTENQKKISKVVRMIDSGELDTSADKIYENSHIRTISVEGSYSTALDPDMAVIDAIISYPAESASEGKDLASGTLQLIIGQLFTMGVKDGAVKSGQISYKTENGTVFAEYNLSVQLPYSSGDVRIAEVFDVLLSAPYCTVNSMRYEYYDTNEAVKKLMEKAFEDAENNLLEIKSAAGIMEQCQIMDITCTKDLSDPADIRASVDVTYKIIE